jgi:hypothetical protein
LLTNSCVPSIIIVFHAFPVIIITISCSCDRLKRLLK